MSTITRFKRSAGSIAVLALINAYATGTAYAVDGQGSEGQAVVVADAGTNASSATASDDGKAQALSAVTVQGINLLPTYLETVPGGTSVASAEELEKGVLVSVPDALKYQPGVYAPSSNGREGARYSMRGSGIIRGADAWHTGIQFLLDGLPLTTAEGYPFQYADPLFYNYTEILRGANGFEYGSTTAGGSINFVPHTGYDSSPFQVRQSFGSWNTHKTQLSSGQVVGDWDYYISATDYHTDGFRDRSDWDSKRLFGDAGYKITDALNTRFYFEYGYENFQNDSNLLLKDALHNPKLNGTLNPATGTYTPLTTNRYDRVFFLVGDKTHYDINDSSNVEGGLLYKYFPLLNNNDNTASGTTNTYYGIHDLAWNADYSRDDHVFGGHDNHLKIATVGNYILNPSTSHVNLTNPADIATNGEIINKYDYKNSYDLQLIFSDDIETVKDVWVTGGLAPTWQQRNIYINQGIPPGKTSTIITPTGPQTYTYPPQSQEQHAFNVLPKLAVRYDWTPKIQYYANYGKTVELPLPHNYTFSGNVAGLKGQRALGTYQVDPQIANSFEVGTRGEEGISRWNLTLYRQKIHDEILQVQTVPATPTTPATTVLGNANSPTIHQGVEASLDLALWRSGSTGSAWQKGVHGVTLRQAFTFTDLHFENDPQFGSNELPGIPRELYQAELSYEHPSGFYAGVDGEHDSRYAADFANTIYAPSYTIWGAKVGYAKPGKSNIWRVFLEGRNLSDKKYVATVTPTWNAAGNYNNSAVFAPGVGRNVTLGLEYDF